MKAILLLLTLTSAGLGGWAWWEHRERTRLEEALADSLAEQDRLAKKARLGAGIRSGVVINEDGPRGLADKAAELGLKIEDGEDEKPRPNSGRKPREKSTDPESPDMAKMLRDPAMRDTIRAQSEAFLEFEYRDLFDQLGLDEAKRDAVMALLKDRVARQTDLGLKSTDDKATPAERDAASTEYTRLTADSGAKLKELLGDKFPEFDRFEKSQPEREHLKTLTSMLKDKNLTLDEATESKLMDAMFESRRAFKFDHDLSDTATLAGGSLSREALDRYLEQNNELQKQIQTKAKAILSPEQFEVFVKSQENQDQITQLGIQMRRRLNSGESGVDGRN